MLDIKFVCNNPEVVKQNIKNKFQEEKLPLVDQVIDLYQQSLKAKQESEALRANRNKLSKQIGMLMGQAKKDPSKKAEADAVKAQVSAQAEEMKQLLRSLKAGRITIFSTHIMDLALDLCDEIVLLSHGELEVVEKSNLDNQEFKEKIIAALKEGAYA